MDLRHVDQTHHVVMIQCTDYSSIRYTKNGDVLNNKPKHLVTPLVIRMTQAGPATGVHRDSILRDKKTCGA